MKNRKSFFRRSVAYALGLVLLLFTISQLYAFMSNNKTERQQYKTILKDGKFEIRKYEAALMATVVSAPATYRGDANHNFRKLAGYIFGSNKKNESIGMTAPVHMEKTDSGSTMSFVMPSRYSAATLPPPNDPSIRIHEVAAGYYAVLEFGGFAPEGKIVRKMKEFEALIEARHLVLKSKPKFLGYNAPFELIGRRNEIVAEIEYAL